MPGGRRESARRTRGAEPCRRRCRGAGEQPHLVLELAGLVVVEEERGRGAGHAARSAVRGWSTPEPCVRDQAERPSAGRAPARTGLPDAAPTIWACRSAAPSGQRDSDAAHRRRLARWLRAAALEVEFASRLSASCVTEFARPGAPVSSMPGAAIKPRLVARASTRNTEPLSPPHGNRLSI